MLLPLLFALTSASAQSPPANQITNVPLASLLAQPHTECDFTSRHDTVTTLLVAGHQWDQVRGEVDSLCAQAQGMAADAAPPSSRILLAWASDCSALAPYIPSRAPTKGEHTRLLVLWHELAAPLLHYALLNVIEAPYVSLASLVSLASAASARGATERELLLSPSLKAAASGVAQVEQRLLAEKLREAGLCAAQSNSIDEMESVSNVLGTRLCALLLLRSGQVKRALALLKEVCARAPTLHAFMGAFELASRLPSEPTPELAAPSRFSNEHMLEVLEHVLLVAPHHGLASEGHLLRWQLRSMLSWGSATLPPSAPLDCPPPEPAPRLDSPRLAIVMPFVASERRRIESNLRRWRLDGPLAPCSDFGAASTGSGSSSPIDFIMLLADAPGGDADSWAQPGELLGDASRCFRAVDLRHAHLSAAEQHYIGGWNNTGPNNLFDTVLFDDAFHRTYDHLLWMESDVVPVAANWLDRLREEAAGPRGFWRKGPAQQPVLRHSMVSTHHRHQNSVGLYRLGQPCYRELLRRVRESAPEAPHDVSTHLFLHEQRNFHIWQAVAHRFLYTDFVQNRLDNWSLADVRAVSADTVLVHGKHEREATF